MPKRKRWTREMWEDAASAKHRWSFDYSRAKYVNIVRRVLIACKVCDHEFYQSPYGHLRCRGCPKCRRAVQQMGKGKKPCLEFAKLAEAVHGGKYDYSKSDYTRLNRKVSIQCRKCGQAFDQNAKMHLDGHGCPRCKVRGGGNGVVNKILLGMGVGFEPEKSFPSLKGDKGWSLRFDFFVPSANLLIEYDDKWHYKEQKWRGSGSLDYSKRRDAIKTQWAAQNGHNLLRIPYWMKKHAASAIHTALLEAGLSVPVRSVIAASQVYWPTRDPLSIPRKNVGKLKDLFLDMFT